MSSDRDEHKVIDLQRAGCLLVEDGNHGEYRPRPNEFGSGDTAFIRAADMEGGRILFETAGKINDVALARITKGIGRGGDILFSHKGTVGKLALAPLDAPPFVCSPQTTFWRTLDEDRLDRRYLYYFMCSRRFWEQWHSRKGETDMADYVSLTAQRALSVVVPKIYEQRAIGRILGALDDKIELNRQMNRTLEAMAQALFKSWFVDLDPVTAKAAGRKPYGMNEETAALFPDSFAETELGLIPEGWRVGRLDDLLILQRGFDLPSNQRRAGKYPVLAASGFSGTHDEFKVKGPGVTTGRSGLLGKVFFVHEDFWPLNTSLWVKEFRISKPIHAYFILGELDFEIFNAGSAVPTLNRNHVHNLKVVVPHASVIERFEKLVAPLFHRHYSNEQESDTLAAVRDALLPKLLSGEIRVRQAENLVAEVV